MTEQDDPHADRQRWRRVGLPSSLADRARGGLGLIRSRRLRSGVALSRGVAFVGTIWTGGEAEPVPGVVVVDGAGRITDIRSERDGLPSELLVLGGVNHWVVPGLVDAHVHLSLLADTDRHSDADRHSGADADWHSGADAQVPVTGLETGLVGTRDLGGPLQLALRRRTGHRSPPAGWPFVAVSGPVLTAPGGYPVGSWTGAGFAEFVTSPVQARWAVQRLAADGVDLIKIVLDPGPDARPVPPPTVVRAVVQAAHQAGLPVVARALTAELVGRAVDAGIDELAHTPTERLSPALVERIASSGMSVASTLQLSFSTGAGRNAAANAADLVGAGVRLLYGTDLAGTAAAPGVDPRELDRLAAAGLGRLGALRSATEWSATAAGMRRRTGRLRVGEPAALVLLPSSPLVEPGVWRTPSAVFADGRLTVSPNAPNHRAAWRPT